MWNAQILSVDSLSKSTPLRSRRVPREDGGKVSADCAAQGLPKESEEAVLF